jgi:2-oxoisovalerate dehydrogenase E2 component (dihydrolipoyl transacylase)
MSEFTFKLPDLGEGTVEAEIAEWMVKVGDTVQEEDTICAMLTDKAAVELTSPVSGKVIFVAGEEGDMVTVGTPLIVFATDNTAGQASENAAPDAAEPAKKAGPESPVTAVLAVAAAASPANTKVLTSPSIRSHAREAGIDLRQVAGSGPKGRILRADFDAFLASQETGGQSAPARAQPLDDITEIKVIGLRRKIA